MAHARFGRASWNSLFDPAIAHAEDGWLVRPHVAAMFALDEKAYGRRSYLDKLAFTGSGRTGKKVMAACAENLTPVIIEAGGKDSLIVDEDADLPKAAEAALWGGMSNAGQT